MTEQTDGESLHLRVTVGEITIEVDGPVDEAETWFESLREDYLNDIDPKALQQQLDKTENTDGGYSEQQAGSPESETKTRTLTEFYRMADGITKKDSALLVGWYLEMKEGQEDFTKSEIEQTSQSAKVELGKNVGRDLGYKVGDGHLSQTGERDGDTSYHVTISGEEYVEGKLL